MDTNSTVRLVSGEGSPSTGAERRLKELGIKLPVPPEPFGTYAEAVQTGNLLFLTGMLPTEGRAAKFVGRVGAELDTEAGREAARLTALKALAVARQHLGSLDRVTRVVRLGVSVATLGDVRDQPKVADGASELPQDVFGKERNPSRLVYGLVIWGKYDLSFELSEPEAYRRDVPKAQVHVLDAGHFALDTAADEIASLVRGFVGAAR